MNFKQLSLAAALSACSLLSLKAEMTEVTGCVEAQNMMLRLSTEEQQELVQLTREVSSVMAEAALALESAGSEAERKEIIGSTDEQIIQIQSNHAALLKRCDACDTNDIELGLMNEVDQDSPSIL
jgi:hypothetical protein